MDLRQTKLYKKMDSYTACSIAEGFCEGENASEKNQLIAWQYIKDTGIYKNLQGFYGRTVASLLDDGYIK